MDIVTINDDKLYHNNIDKFGKKSRAILLSNDQILVANYGGVYLLPGGSREYGETPKETVIRELKEEVGIKYRDNELDEFILLKYYQKKYPTISNRVINRLIITYYYIGNYKGINYDTIERTSREKKDNFYLQLVDLNQIEELMNNNKTDNPRKEFLDREMREVIKVLRLKR